MLKAKTVVLGVTGSIAAYKIANLARMLVKQHCEVHVLMTQNATNFINPITFETLTKHKCLIDTFDRNFEFSVEHVALAKSGGCGYDCTGECKCNRQDCKRYRRRYAYNHCYGLSLQRKLCHLL